MKALSHPSDYIPQIEKYYRAIVMNEIKSYYTKSKIPFKEEYDFKSAYLKALIGSPFDEITSFDQWESAIILDMLINDERYRSLFLRSLSGAYNHLFRPLLEHNDKNNITSLIEEGLSALESTTKRNNEYALPKILDSLRNIYEKEDTLEMIFEYYQTQSRDIDIFTLTLFSGKDAEIMVHAVRVARTCRMLSCIYREITSSHIYTESKKDISLVRAVKKYGLMRDYMSLLEKRTSEEMAEVMLNLPILSSQNKVDEIMISFFTNAEKAVDEYIRALKIYGPHHPTF